MATLVTLYLTPVAYLLLARFSTPTTTEASRLERELDHAANLGTTNAPAAE